ncbi:hypothetical protein AC579_6748 [Pseudocercospora musae]|uniref:Uncharacterized protein n=1 Tax=Pseudocercospora musae TaxID=113226 RepID=A0A139I5Q7_9PEZI|nr:hypothetical protein AC579_6748 [Pseudocercospora musae]
MAYATAGLFLSDKAESFFGFTPTEQDKQALKDAVPKVQFVEKDNMIEHFAGKQWLPRITKARKYDDKSTMKAFRRVTDNSAHDDEPPPRPVTLDLDQSPSDLYSRPQQQESPSSTKAQPGLGCERKSPSPSSTQAQHSSHIRTTDFEEAPNIDPDEAIAYSERKLELGDDPRLVLTEAIMKLMELQMKMGRLHAEAYDELEECLKRVIRISRRKRSDKRGSTA